MKVVTRITEDSHRESVTIAGLTVSRFARQIDGTYAVTLYDVFGGEIVLDQRLTESQVSTSCTPPTPTPPSTARPTTWRLSRMTKTTTRAWTRLQRAPREPRPSLNLLDPKPTNGHWGRRRCRTRARLRDRRHPARPVRRCPGRHGTLPTPKPTQRWGLPTVRDYEGAWKARQRADALFNLGDNLDFDTRVSASLVQPARPRRGPPKPARLHAARHWPGHHSRPDQRSVGVRLRRLPLRPRVDQRGPPPSCGPVDRVLD